MSIVLRPGTPTDAAVCGPICFEAFKAIDDAHNFPLGFSICRDSDGSLDCGIVRHRSRLDAASGHRGRHLAAA